MPPPGFRGVWREDAEARAAYSEGAGIAREVPRVVALPADADDVATLVRWAASRGEAVIPRGSSSGMAGGSIGRDLVLDLYALHDVGAVDVVAGRLRCGPSVTRRDIARAAAAAGLRFPVDPSSGDFCTIGGMVATNASGPHSLAFGSTRRWVTALDCVLADGSRTTVRRGARLDTDNALLHAVDRHLSEFRERAAAVPEPDVRKNSSGYAIHELARSGDLVDLLVGSEGTLAIFVGVELTLAPRPRGSASLLGAWADLDAAMAGAGLAREAGAAACELLDRTFLALAGPALPSSSRHAEAILLVELEAGSESAVDDNVVGRARQLADSFRAAGAMAVEVGADRASSDALWKLRHAASPALARLDPSLRSMQLIEDGCVPTAHLAEYVRGVRRALDQSGFRGVLFGHAGDAHIHANALIDVRDADWRERAARLLDEVVTLTATLGGTLSGEHGDGRLRAPLLPRVWGEDAMRLFRDIKQAFDPAGILNPGVKLAQPGQRPLADVRHDRGATSLPVASRQVLDYIEQHRAWNADRLVLLDTILSGGTLG